MAKDRPNALMLGLGAAGFVLVILLCVIWTLWLMTLTLVPNEAADWILGTRDLDGGAFWHFPDMPPVVGSLGVTGLAVAALGYAYVMWGVMKVLWREICSRLGKRAIAPNPTADITARSLEALGSLSHPLVDKLASMRSSEFASSTRAVVSSIVSNAGLQQRKNTIVKVGDLMLHCVVLAQLLEAGMPVLLITVFVTISALHALVFAVVLFVPHRTTAKTHLLLDALFDFVVAIGFPILVLGHSLSLFNFDMALMAINKRVFTPGSFERDAVVVADPLEVVAVRRSLMSLQVSSWLSIVTRVGTMLMLVRRLHQVAGLLENVWTGRALRFRAFSYGQQRWLGVIFVLAVIANLVFTEESVRTAALACQPHPACAQHAHRWLLNLHHDDLTRCPCLAIVDRNTLVASYEEWLHPPNRTATIAQLATAGMLHTLQLVNRGLTVFPDELRRCKHLRHVSLYYTNTESLPDWFGEFTELEFLHIEGKYPRSSLVHMPERMFDRMSALTFLHLGIHGLETLPALDGATSLRSLALGGMPRVTELPCLDSLRNLQQLTVIALPRLTSFPDLTKLHELMALSVADRGAFCCNGFLGSDKCDLSRSLCQEHPWSGAPAVTKCESPGDVASKETRAVFDRFNSTACFGDAFPPAALNNDPLYDHVALCNGSLYRECHIAGVDIPAMCYNIRWTVITCHPFPLAIEMRREQIKWGLGRPCNPEYEAWLGCGNA